MFKWAFNDGELRVCWMAGPRRSTAGSGFRPRTSFAGALPTANRTATAITRTSPSRTACSSNASGGDLTIKVEDNTTTGEGIYAEPVDDQYQKVDDAEIAYAIVGHLILLKIRPYKETVARYFIFNEKTADGGARGFASANPACCCPRITG